jgi:hypothetical protein
MQNNLGNHTETFTKSYDNGDVFHCSLAITRGIDFNCDYWFITVTVNDYTHTYTRHAGYGGWQHHLYCRGMNNAIASAHMMIDNRITNQRMAITQPLFARMQRILDLFRYDLVLQNIVRGAYPNVLTDTIKIECADVDRAAVENAIAGLTDGITMTWKLYSVEPRYRETSAPALKAS